MVTDRVGPTVVTAAPPVAGAPAEGESAGVVVVIAGSLAALYALLVPLHLLMLPSHAARVMVTVAAASSLGLAAFGWRVHRGYQLVRRRWLAVVAAVPLLNSELQIVITHDLGQTTSLMLAIVAVGAGIAARRLAWAVITAACLSWLLLVWYGGWRLGQVAHLGVQLVMAVVLAAALQLVRARRESSLRAARDELAERMASELAAQRAQIASEQRYHGLFNDSPVGIGLSDEHGHFVTANPALCRLLGRPLAALVGRSSLDFTHPDDREQHAYAHQLIADSADGVVRVEKRYLLPDGQERWAWLTIRHTPGPHGQTWTVAHLQDVTERKYAEQQIADSEANLAAVAAVARRIQRGEDARETIVEAVRDLAGAAYVSLAELNAGRDLLVTASTHDFLINTRIPLTATSAAVTVFRTGQPLFLSDPADNPLVQPSLLRLTDACSLFLLPITSREATIGVLLVGWAQRVDNLQTRPARAVALLADEAGIALEQAALTAALRRRAETDALTGLPNRQGWEESLQRLLSDARHDATPLTIALADLDHFKAYNDQHGHLSGDDLLREMATALHAALRAEDTVARWGGEEFAVALPDCPLAEAETVLARVHAAIPSGQTCSIGYATWDTIETATELMARADAALYTAKNSGRNRSIAQRGS